MTRRRLRGGKWLNCFWRCRLTKPIHNLSIEAQELATILASLPDLDDVLESGLAWLEGITPYDLATVWQVVDEKTLKVRAARGRLKSDRVLRHTIDLTTHADLRRVLVDRQARVNTEHDHRDGDGDLFDDVIDLEPGHSCMVVPLTAGSQTLGLLSLDRNICEAYSPEALKLVDFYARILAFSIYVTEAAQRLKQSYGEERAIGEIWRDELVAKDAPHPLDPVASLVRSKSPRMRHLIEQTRIAAETASAILIRGETGTGKEVLAQAIHRWSPRCDGPFLKVNCASIPEAMLESELFGHVKGAFTGAIKDRVGRFRAAHGGTLFLDEIGDMALALQAKLLRVLQEGTFEPVGSDSTVRVDVRIVAATHVDLEGAIKRKAFREDLFYRINVFPVTLPPLRERTEDLPILVEELVRRVKGASPAWRAAAKLEDASLSALRTYSWPGNIRELANLVERALILSGGDPERGLGLAHLLPVDLTTTTPSAASTASTDAVTIASLDQAIKHHIERALLRTDGKIYGDDGAAALLGLKPSTLQSKMKKLKVGGGRRA